MAHAQRRAPDPNGRRAPRFPQRPPGLTEAQGLEVALGVGERCTVTRAIEARRGPPVRPAVRRGLDRKSVG